MITVRHAPMPEARLQEIAERAAKATKGPWFSPPNDPNITIIGLSDMTVAEIARPMGAAAGRWHGHATSDPWPTLPISCGRASAIPSDLSGDDVAFGNADFIAHAREDIPAMHAEILRLRAALGEARTKAMEAVQQVDYVRLALAAHGVTEQSANLGASVSDALVTLEESRDAERTRYVLADAGWKHANGETKAIIERVRKLPNPWTLKSMIRSPRNGSGAWHCDWCGETLVVPHHNRLEHPDNGCLWPDVHKLASAPKEPTP